MNTTREKRPDRVICKWKDYKVELDEDNYIIIKNVNSIYINEVYIPKSEIPNLIKALEEVGK
ncbi:MAG TPA: hypothetical protein PLX95_04045 [bacterium]|nr:hypothetical protein [bacterium]